MVKPRGDLSCPSSEQVLAVENGLKQVGQDHIPGELMGIAFRLSFKTFYRLFDFSEDSQNLRLYLQLFLF